MVLLVRLLNSLRVWVIAFSLIPLATVAFSRDHAILAVAVLVSAAMMLTGWIVTAAMRRIYLGLIREQRTVEELSRRLTEIGGRP